MHQNMQRKEIKAIARKQLKRNYPDWTRLKKREKREIAKKVLDEAVANYDFKKEIKTDKSELLGIELQKITSGMMNMDEMAQFIEKHKNDVLFKFNTAQRYPMHPPHGGFSARKQWNSTEIKNELFREQTERMVL